MKRSAPRTLLRLKFRLSAAVPTTGDDAFEPLCSVLRRMAGDQGTPPRLRRAIRKAVQQATERPQ